MNRFIRFLETLTEKQQLLLLVGVAFGLRFYAVLMAQGIANDSAAYGFMARDFLKGDYVKGLSSALHPFYPLLISLVSFDLVYVEIAGRLISLFFGMLALIPVYYLVKEAAGQEAGFFWGLFYAFHPYLVTYSGMLLTEATYWGLLVSSVYFFWTGLKREKAWRMALSGIFLGLAYLTRPEGVGYVFVYLIWIVVEGILRKKWLKKFILIGILILPVFIFVIPYILYIHQETGQWLISKKAIEVQSQFSRKSVEQADSFKRIHRNIRGKKDFEILRIMRKIVVYLPSGIYYYLRAYHFSLWPFLFFGLIRIRQKAIAYEWFLACLVLFHLFSLSTFVPSTIRFSVPVIPLSLFWAGTGILEIRRHLEKINRSHAEEAIFLFILFVILIQLPQCLRPERSHRSEQKRIGLWLNQNTPSDAIIMSNSPQEAFYANREFVLLPPGTLVRGKPGRSYEEIIRFAREKGIQYILVDRYTSEINPDFIKSIQDSDLKECYQYKAKDGTMTVVFKIIH
jgi:hypothetical protein